MSRLLNSPWPHAKTEEAQHGCSRCYAVYGLRLRSTIPLTMPELPEQESWDIEVLAGDPLFFEESLQHLHLNSNWAQAHRLPGRWLYARIEGMFDFLISPEGSQVFYRLMGDPSTISFEAYLLGLLMKSILIKKGIDSLHASAVVVDGKAVAFLGSNGFGKSTLAALFVHEGYPLLTDDVLRLSHERGRVCAHAGPPCLKLLPDTRRFLNGFCSGVPMDPGADKWLFPVGADLVSEARFPLSAIYSLAAPEKNRECRDIMISALSPRETLIELLYGTNIDPVVEPDRIRDPFEAGKCIAETVPVRRLSYPWALEALTGVRNAVLADVRFLESSSNCGSRFKIAQLSGD